MITEPLYDEARRQLVQGRERSAEQLRRRRQDRQLRRRNVGGTRHRANQALLIAPTLNVE